MFQICAHYLNAVTIKAVVFNQVNMVFINVFIVVLDDPFSVPITCTWDGRLSLTLLLQALPLLLLLPLSLATLLLLLPLLQGKILVMEW